MSSFTYEIKLDFDISDFNIVKQILENRAFVFLQLDLKPEHIAVSKTRRGYHVYIVVSTPIAYTDYDIAFIQALLGDDFKRATFNFQRVKQGVEGWNVLFTNNEVYEPELSRSLRLALLKSLSFRQKA